MEANNIYLDYNATTPVDTSVLSAMMPYFNEKFGNASSKTHRYGWIAADAVNLARSQVADLINAEPSEIIFTSGATEAINQALQGIFEKYSTKGNHIVTVSTEHKAVLDTCRHLETKGAEITFLNVNQQGVINPGELADSIKPTTILVCIMLANNETGVIQDINAISKIVHQRNCLLMTDATQAVGKIKVDVQEQGIDILTMSAHKIYGPKGVGALFIRRKNPRVAMAPLLYGGGHENGLRSGTLNVPGIVGLGQASRIALNELEQYGKEMSTLRDLLESEFAGHKNVGINGAGALRLPNTSNICFKGMNQTELINRLRGMAVATGSACTSALPEPSHVLLAMGLSEKDAYTSIRFSLGKYTTASDINYVVEKIKLLLTG